MTDGISGWIPLISAALGSIATYAGIIIANRRKVLGYAVLSNTPIVTIKDSHAQQIEISYDRRPVTGLRSTELLIQNIGSKDIEEQDVDLIFPGDILLMNYQVGFEPPTFQQGAIVQAVTTNHIRIHYSLVNPGDKTTFLALTANNPNGEMKIYARGPNLKFKKFDPTYFVSPLINKLATAFSVSCGIMFIYIIQLGPVSQMELPHRIFALLFMGLVLGAPISAIIYQGTTQGIRRLFERMKRIENQRSSLPT